jgi:hypothetical protein
MGAAAVPRRHGEYVVPDRHPIELSEPARDRLDPVNFRLNLLAICLIAASFLLYIRRPYSLASDIGYQVFSARQYIEHKVPALNSIQLVDPHDLSKDIQTSLTSWTPCWTFLFVLAFRAGLAPGPAGRILVALLSVSGAIGWVWVTSLLNLKGAWRVMGVALAALYCMRTAAIATLGSGDLAIYPVAPWLLGASILLADRLRSHFDRRVVIRTILLCLGLGCVYWLKYSGLFMSVPILCALVIEQLRVRNRPRTRVLLAVIVLYGAAFVLPILAKELYSYGSNGTDLVKSTITHSPPRTVGRFSRLLAQDVYYASPTLFAAEPGSDRVTRDLPPAFPWLIRVPGMVLFSTLLYLMTTWPSTYLRNLTVLLAIIPILGFPVSSLAAGTQFSLVIGRCCQPFWILLELVILMLLSQPPEQNSLAVGSARTALAIAAGIQLLLFLWIPIAAIEDCLFIRYKRPPYQASAAGLWVPDLSRFGTRDLDAQIKSLIRGPDDVVIPAIYSNRSFGMDVWIELGGRLLPLTTFFAPLFRTHGREGADFFGTTPYLSSRPLRVILVASNIFERPDFQECVQRIKGRFMQAGQWTRGPLDPDGRVEIWMADLR